jgi:hypothetical protein
LVEHSLGKGEVTSSILVIGSRRLRVVFAKGFVEGHGFSRAAKSRNDERLLPLRFCSRLIAEKLTAVFQGGSNLRRFAGVREASPQPKSRAQFARDFIERE